MQRRAVTLTGTTLLAVAVWTACTGDDPAVTPTGGLAQPCRSGEECNTPDLRCVDGFCSFVGSSPADGGSSGGGTSSSSGTVTSSGSVPADAGADVSITDAGTDAPSEAGDDAGNRCVLPAKVPAGPTCPRVDGGSCPFGLVCCDGDSCVDAGTCLIGWACDVGGTTHCGSGRKCCVDGTPATTGTTCSSALVDGVSTCLPANVSCMGDERRTCDLEGSGCGPAPCVATEVTAVSGATLIVGLCRD